MTVWPDGQADIGLGCSPNPPETPHVRGSIKFIWNFFNQSGSNLELLGVADNLRPWVAAKVWNSGTYWCESDFCVFPKHTQPPTVNTCPLNLWWIILHHLEVYGWAQINIWSMLLGYDPNGVCVNCVSSCWSRIENRIWWDLTIGKLGIWQSCVLCRLAMQRARQVACRASAFDFAQRWSIPRKSSWGTEIIRNPSMHNLTQHRRHSD